MKLLGKTPFFVIGHFALPIPFVLTLASDRAVLYESIMFSMLALLTKKHYSSFFTIIFKFQKTYFKFEVLETFNILGDCCIKTC